MDFKKTLIILGPTAVGKTEISIALAEKIGGEIISADAMQVYRGMDIATAKTTPSQRSKIPHHLIDILECKESYSVARFRKLALTLISEIGERAGLPIVVGGSGLYLRALVDGLFDLPPANWAYRRYLQGEEKEKGPGYLYRRLLKLDPSSARRVHKNDLKRIIRALEVMELTGVPISYWQKQWPAGDERGRRGDEGRRRDDEESEFLMIGLRRGRADLYDRINKRVDKMFQEGLVEETKRLLEQGADRNQVAWQALGYKEVEGYLQGKYSLEEARRRLSRNTRHFAKRQLTWWRKDERIKWVDVKPHDSSEMVVDEICRILREEDRR